MTKKYLRVFQELEFDDIKEHLMIFGTLSASCSKCSNLGIKIDQAKCPSCETEFKYVTFRNIKENFPKIKKLTESRPDIKVIDFDDYKRISGSLKATGLFDD